MDTKISSGQENNFRGLILLSISVEKSCVHLLVALKDLNQAGMAATIYQLDSTLRCKPICFHRSDLILKNSANDEDMEAFCHTWRDIGHLFGMKDQ